MERAANARRDELSQRRNRTAELSPAVHASDSQLTPSRVTDDSADRRKPTLLRHWSRRLALATVIVCALLTSRVVRAEVTQLPPATANALLTQQAQLAAVISALRALALATPPEGLSAEQLDLYTKVMADIAAFVDESAAAGNALNDQLQGLDEANQEQLERLRERLTFQSEGMQMVMDKLSKWLQSSGQSLRKVADNIEKILEILE